MKNVLINVAVLFNLFFSSLLFAGFMEPPAGCQNPTLTCVEPSETRYIEGVPIYQDCWKYDVKYTCPDWSHYTNSCANDLDCTIQGDPVVIDPWKKQLNMLCKEPSVKYECTAYKENKYCGSDISYTNGYEKFSTTSTNNFNNALSAFGLLDALQKSIMTNPLEVFKGDDHICETPYNVGPFTTDCCDKKLHTHGGKWSINQCTNDDIKLAAAQRANRTHYIGSWCKEHLPWPFDHVCIDRHQGYCAFNSILDRIVEEQGRQQLENLALHGGNHTQEQGFNWPFSLSVSQWNRANIKGIDIATYSWESINKDNIPVLITTKDHVNVYQGKENGMDGVTIKLNCKDSVCHVDLNDTQNKVSYAMNPICVDSPAAWILNNISIQQDVCLKVGDQPVGWPSIQWTDHLPNVWQFQILNPLEDTIINGTLNKTLPDGKTLLANGSCENNNCSFKIKVSDDKGEQENNLNFPLSCQESDSYKVSVNDVYIAPKCLQAEEIIAVCNKGSGCDELPYQPENYIGQTYHDWSIFSVNLNVPDYIFLTPSIAAKGNCIDNNCQWQFASIGPQGYETSLKSSISWNMYSVDTKEGSIKSGFSDNVILQTASNMAFKPYLFAPHADLSSGFQLQYKLSNGNWETYAYPVPFIVLENSPIIISTQPLVKLHGSCDQTTGNCDYVVTSEVQVKAKPWGTPQSPNCVGFTPEEMMLIDFSKIDLSEWTKTLNANVDDKTQSELKNIATGSLDDFYSTMNKNGAINTPAPNKSQNVVLNITPKEGQGPFDVTLMATAYWPNYIPYGSCDYPTNGVQNSAVTELHIDWGDGASETINSSQVTAQSVQGNRYNSSSSCTYSMPVFKINHHYQEPPNHTITESILAKFMTSNETHTASFNVINYWDTPTADTTEGGGAASANSHPIHPNQMPGSGTYDPNDIPGDPKNKK